ncbi:SH3 domain-containing protein [Rhizobium rosettiformans]|uniref:SH3 domain-containing protein n=1 Tax=Rhizobium rosettiformans TaxID=1368430 RepID=A0ABX7ESJ9_9HYPH|nr:SH3 domain-containing protein [Rhizobium rosettiformans]QRF51312.1 SH3 domain-containing protein [Rhizobium rosettiformans]
MRKIAACIGVFLVALALFGREDEKPSAPYSAPQPAVVSPEQSPQAVASDQPGATTQPSIQAAPAETMYVTGSGVAFRAGPGTANSILDRFDKGREVMRVNMSADWSQVRDQLTQRTGWIATRFLSKSQPAREAPRQTKSQQPPQQQPRSVPAISDATIVQRIIAQSIERYSGSCPCPYSRDRRGRQCGKRSAYSKPGGYAPVCFAEDVSRDMIAAFRQQ